MFTPHACFSWGVVSLFVTLNNLELIFAKLSFNFNFNFNLVESWLDFTFDFDTTLIWIEMTEIWPKYVAQAFLPPTPWIGLTSSNCLPICLTCLWSHAKKPIFISSNTYCIRNITLETMNVHKCLVEKYSNKQKMIIIFRWTLPFCEIFNYLQDFSCIQYCPN